MQDLLARHRVSLATSLLAGLLSCLPVVSAPLAAQDEDRIWGRVHTTSGEQLEGFIRWDRNEGSWVDILDGSKEVPPENYDVWLEANAGGQRPTRSLELRGYRITWIEDDPDFPRTATSGVRFGHLDELIVRGDDQAEIVLKSGVRLELTGGSTDIGRSIRELIVETPGGDETELEWEELERVDFFAAPPAARAPSHRLYGTVEDHRGRTYAGYISWDLDEILESDVLDGDDETGDSHSIPFADIRSIEGHRRSATVTLRTGEVLELDGSNDVDRGNRGVQISDPTLGMIEVEWDELHMVRFEAAPQLARGRYDDFDGGHPLYGTVVTTDGEDITGFVRWDADEQWSWELLDGSIDDIDYTIEFSNISRIRRNDPIGVEVTLVDGRRVVLEEGNDVDWDNKGILIGPAIPPAKTAAVTPAVEGALGPATAPPVAPGDSTAQALRYVFWDDLAEVHFDHEGHDEPADTGGPEPSAAGTPARWR